MLETDDVDQDYFTPIASTSLANIFGKSSHHEETSNESLKYSPPRAQNVTKLEEGPKVTECVFACALLGYEWSENVYSSKGKVGFAVLKTTKTNAHNIVLYDSNKSTLSTTAVTSKLEVIVKGNVCLSYYDSRFKYWSVYGTEEEINKIVEILKENNVIVTYSGHTDKELSESKIENQKINAMKAQFVKGDKGSDTDSSVNRRTKESILSRMASMGHSVLPPHAISHEKESDSSDPNDVHNNHPKATRHKPVKSLVKRINTDKSLPEVHNLAETQNEMPLKLMQTSEITPFYTYADGQLVPVTSTNIITSSGSTSECANSIFTAEQRINNSELRINMNRMTDKVDQILDKIKDLGYKGKDNSSTSDFQTEIYQKLLAEYESKIKMYEDIIKAQNHGSSNINQLTRLTQPSVEDHSQIDIYFKSKISELETEVVKKNNDVTTLRKEIEDLTKKIHEITEAQAVKEDNLLQEIINLKQELRIKNEEIINICSKSVQNTSNISSDIGCKLKIIMNDTFQAISANIESNEHYSGETIKQLVAMVIKKITIESLSDLQ